MKRLFRNLVSIFGCLLLACMLAQAAQLKEAHVTQVVSDVKLLPEQAAPRPAAINDPVRNGTAVRTGTQSRSELTFTDLTITRLGANTIFSFKEGTRTMNLGEGAILFQVPKGAGGATIKTAAITAAITGTTGIGEYHRATTENPKPVIKWFCLEGHIVLSLTNGSGQTVELEAGQMIVSDGTYLPKPVFFDISTLVKSSLFFLGFETQLASWDLIQQEIQKQLDLKIAGGFVDSTLVAYSDLTPLTSKIDQALNAESPSSTETPSPTETPTPTPSTPTPTPSKFGAPIVIASPDPYVISSGTTISTDPAITTNGQTDFGKIWRGPAQDGPLSAFIFGSTSAFDTASGFDNELNGSMGGAGFKFTFLKLTGDPTISTVNGSINLGLIAVNGITSGGPGGVLTFAGLRGLLLATQNGSITLGPEISFSGLHDITFYARGAGSMLTLASDVSTTNKIRLYGQGGIQLNSDLSTQDLIAFTGGDFNFDSGSITAETLAVTAGATINMGANTPVTINGSEASLLIPNSGTGNIPGNATITLQTAGNLVLNGANGLSLTIDNTNGGHIGQAANISLKTADLTAGSLNVFINNRNGGSIGSFANVACNILGNLTIAGDANIGTSNRNDGLGGGTMGTDSRVVVQANSISVGGLLAGFVSANAGGHIGNVGLLQLNVTGDIHSGGGTSLLVQSTGFNVIGGPFIAPGFIGSDAVLNVTAAALTSDTSIDAEVDEDSGRNAGNATLNLNIIGAITAPDITFRVGGSAGQIGGDASLGINAGSISAANTQLFQMANAGGNISGNASLNVGVTGTITAPDVEFLLGDRGGQIGGNASMVVSADSISASTTGPFFQIVNPNSGSIGGNATIDVTTMTLSGNQLFVAILNSVNDGTPNGTIGSNATINVTVGGNATIATDATLEIDGSDDAESAAININGGNYDAGGTFRIFIDGDGVIAFNNASVHADVLKVGALGTNGVLNIGGGTLSADTELKLYASGSNGQLNFISNVTLGGNGSKILAANSVTIFNNVVVTIGGESAADVYTNQANYTGSGGNNSTTGTFAGAGANQPQPLPSAPPFDDSGRARANAHSRTPSSTNSKRSGGDDNVVKNSSKRARVINVSDSGQLLALLDGVAPGGVAKIAIPIAKGGGSRRNSGRMNLAGRLGADRAGVDLRTEHLLPAARLP